MLVSRSHDWISGKYIIMAFKEGIVRRFCILEASYVYVLVQSATFMILNY